MFFFIYYLAYTFKFLAQVAFPRDAKQWTFPKALCQTINSGPTLCQFFFADFSLVFACALYQLCIWQLFTCSSDFYIFRKSCNCYFTAENIMKSVSCFLHLFPKPILAKGLCIRMSSIIIELSRQIDFFEPIFPARPCSVRGGRVKAILQAQHPVNLCNWDSSMHHWRSLQLKILGQFESQCYFCPFYPSFRLKCTDLLYQKKLVSGTRVDSKCRRIKQHIWNCQWFKKLLREVNPFLQHGSDTVWVRQTQIEWSFEMHEERWQGHENHSQFIHLCLNLPIHTPQPQTADNK